MTQPVSLTLFVKETLVPRAPLLIVPAAKSANEMPREVFTFGDLQKAGVVGAGAPNHKYIRRKPDGKGGWDYVYTAPKGQARGLRAGATIATRTGAAGKLRKITHDGKVSTFHAHVGGQAHEFRYDGKQWAGRKAGGKWGKLQRTPIHLPEQRGAKQAAPAKGKIAAGGLLAHQKAFQEKQDAHKRTPGGQIAESKKRLAAKEPAHAATQRGLIQAHTKAQAQIQALQAKLAQQHAAHRASMQGLVAEHKQARAALTQAQRSGNRQVTAQAKAHIREHAAAQARMHGALVQAHKGSLSREQKLHAQLSEQGAQIKAHAKLLASLQGGGKAKSTKGTAGQDAAREQARATIERQAGTPPPLPGRGGRASPAARPQGGRASPAARATRRRAASASAEQQGGRAGA